MIEIDWGLKLSVLARMLLTQITYISFVTIVMHHCLERRKSYKYLIVWETIKLLLVNNLLAIILEDVRMAYRPLQVFYAVAYLISGLFTCAIYLYTFVDIPKTVFLYAFVEPLAVLLGIPGQIVGGMIQNRPVEYELPPVPSDLIMYIMDIVIMAIVIRLLKPVFHRFRKYEMKHPRFWCWFLFCYIIGASMLTTLVDLSIMHTTTITVAMVSVVAILAYTIMEVWYLWQKQVHFQNDYLKRQKELYSIHYESIQRQIIQMERAQKEIDQQMTAIVRMDEQEQTDEKIITYLRSLRQKRDEIEAGIYCNDWIVDGILYYYAKQCKAEKICTDFQMQKYDRGIISDEDISEILLILFELVMKEEKKNPEDVDKKIVFSASRVKNYLMLKMECTGKKNKLKAGKCLKEYLSKYNGSLQIENMKGSRVQIEVALQVE